MCKSRSPHDIDNCYAIHPWKAPRSDWKVSSALVKNVKKARKDPKKRKLIEESEARQEGAKKAKLATETATETASQKGPKAGETLPFNALTIPYASPSSAPVGPVIDPSKDYSKSTLYFRS